MVCLFVMPTHLLPLAEECLPDPLCFCVVSLPGEAHLGDFIVVLVRDVGQHNAALRRGQAVARSIRYLPLPADGHLELIRRDQLLSIAWRRTMDRMVIQPPRGTAGVTHCDSMGAPAWQGGRWCPIY